MNTRGHRQSFTLVTLPGAGTLFNDLPNTRPQADTQKAQLIYYGPTSNWKIHIGLSVCNSLHEKRSHTNMVRFLWGGVMMCHAACSNWSGLMTVRFFLGVGEAAIAPGFTLLTGMFYQRKEQPLRYVSPHL